MAIDISSTTRRIVYTGSAGVGPYAFNFEVLAQTDIAAYFNDTELTLTTDFTVSIDPDGTGSVTIVTGTNVPTTPDADDRITIVGARDIERTTDFTTGGPLFATSLNDEFDSLTIFTQQNKEEADRSIKAPVTDPSSINMTLPKDDDRKGKYLSFNATTGNPEVVNAVVDINTIAGIASDVTTVSGIASNVTSVAGNATNINTVATNISNVNTTASSISNVNTVSASISNVNAVAGNATNINTVAGISTDVTAVAAIDTAVSAVNANSANINTVSTNIANVNTLGPISSDITTVAGISGYVTTVATDSTNISTVATDIADVNLVAGNIANVITVASANTDINTIATNLGGADTIGTVATNISNVNSVGSNIANVNTVAGNSTNITTVANNETNINTVATNVTDVVTFAETYLGAFASAPTTTTTGALYYNTTLSQLYIWNGSAWDQAAFSITGTVTSFNTRTGAITLSATDVNNALGSDAVLDSDIGVTVQAYDADIAKYDDATANFQGNLVVDGDLTINGTTTTISATELAIEDNLIYLNDGSTVTNPDLGWVGNYNDGTYAHAGIFRDATDGTFKFFDSYTPEPGSAIDTAHGSFALADVSAASFTGNLTGDVTGNADTADALSTARTIGGVSFDGSANINLPGVNTTGNQNTTGTASNITAYTINQNLGTTSSPTFATVNATTVDLGNWTVTESGGILYFATSGTNKMKLDASGNLTVTGDVTAYGTI